MSQFTRRGFVGSVLGATAATVLPAQQVGSQRRPGSGSIKITDLKCAIIGRNPVIRIVTDQGISGYAQGESAKPYLKPMVLYYKPYLVGEDPRDVGRIMLKIRRMGAFKPWGAAISSIEIALWDIAGQAAELPVYELLGGKIHDRVCAYGNSENNARFDPRTPQDYAELAAKVKEAKEGYKLVKVPVGFHNAPMMNDIPDAWYGQRWTGRTPPYMNRGLMTERGIDHVVACVEPQRRSSAMRLAWRSTAGPAGSPRMPFVLHAPLSRISSPGLKT
jgi:L-alanine-DL-glutamate epimerase-like enolase superfamily enzyme